MTTQPDQPHLLYIYDGTFEGWLTAVASAKAHPDQVQGIVPEDAQQDLFSEKILMETDPERAERVFQHLRGNYSEEAVVDVMYAFLSETDGIELPLFRYLLRLWRYGEPAAYNFADESVATVQLARDRVAHEILRFQGFVRFRRLKSGVYYAPIAPDANIVQFLAPHFAERFSDQSWVIHDTRRNIGLYYDGSRCRFLDRMDVPRDTVDACRHGAANILDILDGGEGDLQELWNSYFRAVAIEERINPRLQRQRMPVRYWGYLVEKAEMSCRS